MLKFLVLFMFLIGCGDIYVPDHKKDEAKDGYHKLGEDPADPVSTDPSPEESQVRPDSSVQNSDNCQVKQTVETNGTKVVTCINSSSPENQELLKWCNHVASKTVNGVKFSYIPKAGETPRTIPSLEIRDVNTDLVVYLYDGNGEPICRISSYINGTVYLFNIYHSYVFQITP